MLQASRASREREQEQHESFLAQLEAQHRQTLQKIKVKPLTLDRCQRYLLCQTSDWFLSQDIRLQALNTLTTLTFMYICSYIVDIYIYEQEGTQTQTDTHTHTRFLAQHRQTLQTIKVLLAYWYKSTCSVLVFLVQKYLLPFSSAQLEAQHRQTLQKIMVQPCLLVQKYLLFQDKSTNTDVN